MPYASSSSESAKPIRVVSGSINSALLLLCSVNVVDGLCTKRAAVGHHAALDAGDPSFDPADADGDPMTDDALPHDQRRAPFHRVFDGNSVGAARIGIGAYELQPTGVPGGRGTWRRRIAIWHQIGTNGAHPRIGSDRTRNIGQCVME